MRKAYFIVICILAVTSHFRASAQDILTTRDGTELRVKVTEVSDDNVKYKSWDNQDGPIYTMERNGILFIKYENGTKDVFKIEEDEYSTKLSMKERGKLDAEEYYHRYQGARMTTYATTVVGGAIIGLVPAIACSKRMPADHRLDYPDSTLMKNKEYRRAYKHTAKKIKQGKTWGGYVWGIVTNILIGIGLAIAIAA
ncbi:MAG: hypothetical protein JST70_12555 [Bacteroidetes bacterium]|nr:hypothetical protein [Bacteroidota bacterium]